MALELGSPAIRPAATTIRRSEEGQIAVVTRFEVHIIVRGLCAPQASIMTQASRHLPLGFGTTEAAHSSLLL